MEELQRLGEYTKDEWFSVAKQFFPNLTREQYEVLWQDYLKAKAEHERSQMN